MKKYDSYKDTNVIGFKTVPSHWDLTRLKFVANYVKTGSTPPSDNKEYYEGGNIPWYGPGDFSSLVLGTSKKHVTQKAVQDKKCRIYDKDSILLVGIGATVGKIGLAKEECSSNQQINAISLDKARMIPSYALYFLNSIKEHIVSEADSSTLPIFNQTQTKELRITNPPLEEQAQIANYLDLKTTQIDDLICKKEKLIELLKEERTAIINQAVTKGLDPNAPMKDSGIEWLGEIPKHWTRYRIDWIAEITRGNTGFKRDELLNKGEYVALQYGKVYKVDIVDDSFNFFVNSEFYKESQVVSKGDTILVSTSETMEDLGHTCYYNKEQKGLIGGEQILLKPNRKLLNEKYLYRFSQRFCPELRKYAKGLKVFRYNTHDLKSLFIAIPTVEEQIQIADYIDSETNRISNAIQNMFKEIELMKEYKTALISEVVTGKVDVRDEVLN